MLSYPDILREFDKDVTGYSLGKGLTARSHFNQAVSGAVAKYMTIILFI